MNISFELPPNIEQEISANGADLSGEAREAYLVELYRQDRISITSSPKPWHSAAWRRKGFSSGMRFHPA